MVTIFRKKKPFLEQLMLSALKSASQQLLDQVSQQEGYVLNEPIKVKQKATTATKFSVQILNTDTCNILSSSLSCYLPLSLSLKMLNK